MLLSHLYVTQIAQMAEILIQGLRDGNKLLICGNGGSAADAQHFAAELVTRYKVDRAPIAALALTTDASILTSVGNDYHYDLVFRKQVEALGKRGDILVAISTSGRSKNVLEAVQAAQKKGLKTMGLMGGNLDSPLSKEVDIAFHVPSTETARIQESHILVIHILSELIENEFAHGPSL
ncbi:MAG: SIS domain-containing protein [Chlamydiae bacterium]|nr:SIS domain-containing protein [Chlamydiota bacterium]MBI3277712.1 SIS domain-containing protein [Chlamydiota bacterium]